MTSSRVGVWLVFQRIVPFDGRTLAVWRLAGGLVAWLAGTRAGLGHRPRPNNAVFIGANDDGSSSTEAAQLRSASRHWFHATRLASTCPSSTRGHSTADRQTDRQIDRRTDEEAVRRSHTQAKGHRDRKADRAIDKQTDRFRDIERRGSNDSVLNRRRTTESSKHNTRLLVLRRRRRRRWLLFAVIANDPSRATTTSDEAYLGTCADVPQCPRFACGWEGREGWETGREWGIDMTAAITPLDGRTCVASHRSASAPEGTHMYVCVYVRSQCVHVCI